MSKKRRHKPKDKAKSPHTEVEAALSAPESQQPQIPAQKEVPLHLQDISSAELRQMYRGKHQKENFFAEFWEEHSVFLQAVAAFTFWAAVGLGVFYALYKLYLKVSSGI